MPPLDRYREKRDFDRTPEPLESGATATGRAFCVQRHAARRLHHDLRLELGGVLLSWAVTRGPSLDPSEKRLAVRTEDHPTSYRDFEGVIPDGYGKGTVMLWDRGDWEPLGDPVEGLRKGRLSFLLHGQRLTGKWSLTRLKPEKGRENWLLVKATDAVATPGIDDLTDRHATSVATRRTLDQIARGTAAPGRLPRPAFRPPMLAQAFDNVPEGDGWVFEPKHDGYRCQIALGEGGARCFSRSGQDWTDRFAAIARAAEALPARAALIDAEAVADEETFAALQAALSDGAPVAAYAFDLLHLDGQDLTGAPFHTRRLLLEGLLSGLPRAGALRLSPVWNGAGGDLLAAICAAGREGIIAKRRDAQAKTGRSPLWRKIKCGRRAEFVVAGWTPSPSRARPFGALILATMDSPPALRGKVGTGFSDGDLARIALRLDRLSRPDPPFPLRDGTAPRNARWVDPVLVAEVRFAEITPDGALRHAVFLGLRDDKPAPEVTMETPRRSAPRRPTPGRPRLTSADRVIFPDRGITKGDLAHYYETVARRLLAHGRDHPVSLIRCPDGVSGDCFFQKHAGAGFDAMPSFADADARWLALSSPASVLAAVQMGAVEFHLRGPRQDRLDQPDRMVIDLDPDEGLPFAAVRDAAAQVRDVLAGLGLTSGVLVTGGKGLHVVVPLRRGPSVETVKTFAQAVATLIADRAPDRYTAKMAKAARVGRIFLDWQRNARGATAICPWSVRARPGAPVAVPVGWDELDRLTSAAAFPMERAMSRAADPDPLAAIRPVTLGSTAARRLEQAVRS